jgi:hypothetical protein
MNLGILLWQQVGRAARTKNINANISKIKLEITTLSILSS